MGRAKRIDMGGIVYHVINRANGRLRIFKKKADFEAFERILAEGVERYAMRVCGYCIMGNHWHLVLWPRADGDMSQFMRWVTLTHTQRWHAAHGTVGIGHLYQGRYKSFPVQGNCHYLTVMRYVEANPLRAEIVDAAGDWPWSSFAVRMGLEKELPISRGPVALPANWPGLVALVMEPNDLAAIEKCLKRGAPLGNERWVTQTAAKLQLQSTLRPRGRPRKGTGHL
ncbi:MAG: transposase [Anaerohalosphaera sp.]|nr:transposase [Anaerohalosphaera sp.]